MARKKKTEERNSSFELLRIVAMIMIVAHHFSVHGDFSFESNLSFNKVFIEFLSLGGKIGVDIFILISGYFLIKNDKIKLKKIIKLWCQIFFYSLIFYLGFTLFGYHSFTIPSFIKTIFPIIFNKYWFATVYFLLYLYIPYINKFLSKLDKNYYKKLLLTMFICWSVIPTLTKQSMYLNEFIWFLFLYFFAGYIRLHYKEERENNKKYLFYATSLYIGTIFITVLIELLSCKWNFLEKYATYLYGMEKLPVFFISVFLVLWFKSIPMKSNKGINLLATTTFGVYLIHDNELVRKFLWNTFFQNGSYFSSNYLFFYAIFVILTVYVISTVIELVRIKLLEKPMMKWLETKDEKIENLKTKLLKKLKLEK